MFSINKITIADLKARHFILKNVQPFFANELGLRHPKNFETGEDVVMTTDFLITVSTEDGIKEIASLDR